MIVPEWQSSEYGTWRGSDTVADGETSDTIQILYNTQRVTVAAYPETEAYVEYSVSPIADVQGGTARWIKWPLGNVTENAADGLLSTITAVRLVSVSGAATIEVMGQ